MTDTIMINSSVHSLLHTLHFGINGLLRDHE